MARPIAYLTSFYARAGDTFIRREVEELRRRGIPVHTFSIRRADEGEGVSEEILREQRSTDYVLEHGALRLALSFCRLAVKSPARMVRAIRLAGQLRWPGLRSFLLHGAYLLEASYLAEQLVARDVALLHDHISMSSASVALLASALSGVPFSMTVHGPHDFLAAEQWALGRKVAAAVLTVCISDFGRSQCMLVTPPEHWPKVEVLRCGVDASFLEEPPAATPASRTLVSVGRLSPEKGQVLLVEAVGRLRAAGVDVELALVGDGPSRPVIEARARELGVADRVQLLGWRSSAEVRRIVAQSRALVLPSFAEGIPIVLMEAMAMRRPVIATYVGGIPELVRPGESGWLVPSGELQALTAAMREALEASPEQLSRMGERGREQVLQRHHPSLQGERLAALLGRAAGEPTAARGERGARDAAG
jgi:colanic acid/amylovoran biosynthesis glycosyltransferase